MFDHGNPSTTGLYYNTNTTICKEELFKIWQPFKEVYINFSIDDIEKRFEYQRYNAIWNESLDNMQKYKELAIKHNVNMTLRLYVTVGILNVLYLKEFVERMKPLGIPILFNMVHYPHYYSIVNLPTKVKDVIKEKLLSIDFENLLDTNSPTIDNITNFMYGSECDPELLKTFFHKTKIHDEFRKDSFSETFPELYELLKVYT